ncbi:DUF1415 family protein [Alteromonas genovensis]|uniref:DUF1415 family protein n=1 Tax=Alteromonas genovensis TaxID=471225 RepID=A0A6N9TFR0_9ALTE|nr:DUF1415 domain-containing protein [Alteromonas genovensis]NDW14379.1 DUF1415 family protein [Alteromonas genovensis]
MKPVESSGARQATQHSNDESSGNEQSSDSHAHYTEATMQWVDDVVIHHNFCPFASFVRTPNQIHCSVIAGNTGDVLEALFEELKRLDNTDDIATTLIILSNTSFSDFNEYLDVLSIAEAMLHDWGFLERYQLASFHPQYVFEGNSIDDSENYTNRSPYPLLHIIRESDITRYMKNEEDAQKIYTHNIAKANELGCPYFEKTLSSIKQAKNNKDSTK